jgi:fatty-acid desaturase
MTAAWEVVFGAIALTQGAVIATSIYLHRALAHRSIALHPYADLAFRIALWLQDRTEASAVAGGASQAPSPIVSTAATSQERNPS